MSHAGDRFPTTGLGLLDATMVGIGAMIGAGIFVLTGLAAETAGSAAIFVFALNGGVTTFTALSYAELASAIPRNGGGYAYVREAFSAPIAFVMGWTRWFTYMVAGALYALGFSSNFVEFIHLYGVTLPGGHVLYALLVVVGFVALNALSTEALRSPRGSLIIADAEGGRMDGPDTVLEAGERFLVAVESDVADEVLNLLRGVGGRNGRRRGTRRRRFDQNVTSTAPPSMTMAWPVMNPARSEQR